MSSVALIRRSYRSDGGAEHALSTMITAYKGLGFRVILLCEHWDHKTSTFDEIHRFKTFGFTRFGRLKSFTKQAEDWIREHPDIIVQSHEWVAGAHILRLGDGLHSEWIRLRSHNLSVVARLIQSWSLFHYFKIAQEKKALNDPRTRVIMVNSRFVQSSLKSMYPDHYGAVVLIRNICRMRERLLSLPIKSYDDSRIVLGFLGSGWSRKGLKTAITTLKFLGKRYHLVVGGTDKNVDEYQRYAESLNVCDRINWLGVVVDICEFYRGINCLILPSSYDPFPNVVNEAMAAGVPIVISSNTGANDFEGLNGITIVKSEKPAHYADAVAKLIESFDRDDSSLRRAVSDFDEAHVRIKMAEVIDKVIDANPAH